MSQIDIIKAKVSPADAGRHYGLKISRNGMALCPFHNDTNPSMKLYGDHFFCFACGAHGDVIDLTARLLGLNFTETVRRLAVDFGIGPNNDPPMGSLPQRAYLSQFRRDELLCVSTLTEYERVLRRWKQEYAPKIPDTPIDDRYVEACQMLDTIEYLADYLLCKSIANNQDAPFSRPCGATENDAQKLHARWLLPMIGVHNTAHEVLSAATLEERIKTVDDLMQNGLIDRLRQRLEEVNSVGRAA